MEESELILDECDSDQFFDALDKFQFLQSIIMTTNNFESEESIEFSNLYRLEFIEDGGNEVVLIKVKQSSELLPLQNGFKQHRSSFGSNYKGTTSDYSKESNCNSLIITDVTQISDGIKFTPREKRNNFSCTLEDFDEVSHEGSSDSPMFRRESNVAFGNKDLPLGNTIDDPLSSLVVFMAGLMIKAIGFQFNLFVNFFMFPFWFMYCSMIFVTDPFRVIRWAIRRITHKFLSIGGGIIPYVFERITGERSIGKFAIRLGWGLFWAAYVGFILFGFLISGFIIGSVVMRYIVEEPIRTTEPLNFDYTKSSPVAMVPILGCPSASCGANCDEKFELGNYVGSPIIPPNHKLQLTISLTMPESEYNRKLGVFQVRVDFLSANGKVTTSSSYPCMLRFKSQLIRYMETFINTVPLLAGYSSESQILDLKMKGFSEEDDPTSCLMVVLDQRAEYKPGAGIPEIYAASMVIESELPLHKRIIWYWRKTLFVWTSIASFLMELLLVLVCCRPIIIPRARPRRGSANEKIGSGNTTPLIKGR